MELVFLFRAGRAPANPILAGVRPCPRIKRISDISLD